MADKSFPNYCQLTFETEGGTLRIVLRPHWPGGVSGVTIGPGYDMKERTAADVRADLIAAGVPADEADKLKGAAGKGGTTARDWIKTNYPGRDAVISTEASANLFTHVYPTYARLVREKVSEKWEADWDALPLRMKEVLVDLAYRGDISRFKSGSTRHERLVKPLVVANDYAGFRRLMNDFSYWQDNTNLPDMPDGGPNSRITRRGDWLEGPPPPTVSPVHLPLDLGCGLEPSEDAIEGYYEHTETEHRGGYFPIGANTVWHGGLHLHAPAGSSVHALWDGTIVAARLAEDSAKVLRHYGSVSFLLLAHELGGATLNKLRPKGKLIGYKVRIEAIRLRGGPGLSGERLGVLEREDELERLSSELTKADNYNWCEVKVTKAKDASLVGKTGYCAISDQWYWAIREELEAEELDESKTYRLYSLYMHLNGEALGDDNEAIADVEWLQAAPSVSTDALTKRVGEDCDNVAADVRKVQERLKVHEAYSGPVHGQVDEATLAAIYEFQERLVAEGQFSRADGVISPGRKTWQGLQKAPEGTKLDEDLLAKLRSGDVVALDKPVSGGDKLWTSGLYGSSGYRTGMIHWELFSEDNLVPFWTSIEDDDDDFNLDSEAIVSLVDQDGGYWESDEILTLDEVVRFYETHPKAQLLRKYACKFISEWGVDLDIAIPKMLDYNYFSSWGLEDRMRPYLWWEEAKAAGVELPASAKCWHYNPIALTAGLAKAMPGSHDNPVDQASGEHVFVTRNGSKVPHYSQGDTAWGNEILGSSASIRSKGCAITSVAMILKYYGRDVTPKTMDEYLDDNSGYSGDSVIWSTAFKCSESADLKFGGRQVVTSGFKEVLDQRIADNKPTLARVDYADDANATYNHFVVIVGRHKDGHYIMNDPATSKGNGAADPSDANLIEKTTRHTGYVLVQLDIFDPV